MIPCPFELSNSVCPFVLLFGGSGCSVYVSPFLLPHTYSTQLYYFKRPPFTAIALQPLPATLPYLIGSLFKPRLETKMCQLEVKK